MYTVDYFINKFEAIPENEWVTHFFGSGDKHCALGHCGCRVHGGVETLKESISLAELLRPTSPGKDNFWLIADINDGNCWKYNQSTPKARILAALRDIKAMQEKEPKPERIKTVYVSIPETIKEQSEQLILS